MKLQLNYPPALQAAMTRFDALSLRERVLVGMVVLAIPLLLWDQTLMQPLNARQANLLSALQEDAPADASSADAEVDGQPAEPELEIGTALLQRESLQAQLARLDQQLQTVSSELIAPERTSEVLYEVLQKQRHLNLISLRKQPVTSLIAAPAPAQQAAGAPVGTSNPALGPGPYVHPVELIVEGRYLDILNYLRTLEALPWRFDWQALELDSRQPLTRARIQLSTLSLDAAWIGT